MRNNHTVRLIELTKVPAEAVRDSYSDTDDVTENGGEAAAPVAGVKVMVNVETIRCFNARKDNMPGTRLTFIDGGGFPVTESYDEVKGLVSPN